MQTAISWCGVMSMCFLGHCYSRQMFVGMKLCVWKQMHKNVRLARMFRPKITSMSQEKGTAVKNQSSGNCLLQCGDFNKDIWFGAR
jgi:hypothetical protein